MGVVVGVVGGVRLLRRAVEAHACLLETGDDVLSVVELLELCNVRADVLCDHPLVLLLAAVKHLLHNVVGKGVLHHCKQTGNAVRGAHLQQLQEKGKGQDGMDGYMVAKKQ